MHVKARPPRHRQAPREPPWNPAGEPGVVGVGVEPRASPTVARCGLGCATLDERWSGFGVDNGASCSN